MKTNYKDVTKLFKILSHPTRLAILEILRGGEQCVCHMEAVLGVRQAHISQHLMILREAQIVVDRREGWNIYYRVTQQGIYHLIDAARELLGEPADAEQEFEFQEQPGVCPCPKCQLQSKTEIKFQI